jgi:hypothetical protein
LAHRIARFHLVDNTRGEPPMWENDDIKLIELSLDAGRLTGAFHLETANGKRGFQGELAGIVETEGEEVTRFDLVAHGQYWGQGPFTGGAPKGKFPLAVAFTLADGKDEADKVRPQASRGWVQGYLRSDR